MILDASDFSYTESTKELTLSYSGLNKISSASLTAKQKYPYTITFKFTDYSSVDTTDTKTLNVTVNLIKAQMITKTDIENMMKAVKYKEGGLLGAGDPNAGEIIVGDGAVTTFSFANATFSSSNPNFKSTGKTFSLSSTATVRASGRKFSLAYAIGETTLFKTYFGSWLDIDYDSTPPAISSSKKDCDFTIKFKKLQSGYALSSEVAHLMTTGLTIRLTLDDKANWQ